MVEALSAVLLLGGCSLMLLAGLGLLRLPDFYCRSHAIAKATTLGIGLVLLAVWLQLGTEVAGMKIALALVFQFITIPVASHLMAVTARRRGLQPWRNPRGPSSGQGPNEAR